MTQTNSYNIAAIVMAGGKGTRMKSNLPKALFPMCGLPIAEYALRAVKEMGTDPIVVVVGHQADRVKSELGNDYQYALQEPQLGTGHAAQIAMEQLESFDGSVLILPGDAPLITTDILTELVSIHNNTKADCTLAVCQLPDPAGYGRIIRNADGNVIKITEERDATPEEKNITEINASIYCVKASLLKKYLPKLSNNTAQKEYYLTDLIQLAGNDGAVINTLTAPDPTILQGVNSRWDLSCASQIMRMRILKKLAMDGVTIVDPNTTYIDCDITIGVDTTIMPLTVIEGKTTIGAESTIGPYARIKDSEIGDRTSILSSNLTHAIVGDEVRVGPYANLRVGAILKNNCVVGDFVEVKNSIIEERAAAAHLSYIGDAIIGERTNVGAGTITCNYDGKKKHKTKVGKRAFIGSHSTLVAPVEIGDGAVIAAGSVITENVPDESLGIGRGRQTNKEGWAKKWRERE